MVKKWALIWDFKDCIDSAVRLSRASLEAVSEKRPIPSVSKSTPKSIWLEDLNNQIDGCFPPHRTTFRLPAEFPLSLWEGERSIGVAFQVCHSVVHWSHIKIDDSSAVVQWSITHWEDVSKRKTFDLYTHTHTHKKCYIFTVYRNLYFMHL